MVYSNLFTEGRDKKIPTLLGIVLIGFVVVFFFNLMGRSAVPSKASKITLKRTEVTNLTPIQATIYWQTDSAGMGWIIYGEKQQELTRIALDDRDVSEKKSAYINHYVTIRNLKPGGHYYFAVISQNQKIVRPDGALFEFSTPTTSLAKTKIDPATGKVLQANLNPLPNAVILLYVDEKTVPRSGRTKDSGEWLIPLNSFYDKETLEEKSLSGGERTRVEVISEEGGISTITSKLGDLALNAETIIIGKNYNFVEADNVLSASAGFKNDTRNETGVEIFFPEEGALIPGKKPLISGVSLPGAEISIVVNSLKTYSAKIRANRDGKWSYVIPEDLELGEHTITIKTKDREGKEVTLSKKFTIIDNGGYEGKVLGTASGEPTITYAPTATPTPTASPPVSGITSLVPVIGGISLLIIGGGILLVF